MVRKPLDLPPRTRGQVSHIHQLLGSLLLGETLGAREAEPVDALHRGYDVSGRDLGVRICHSPRDEVVPLELQGLEPEFLAGLEF